MRISATGNLTDGFSLIELLVVMVIIGLFAATAVLSLNVVGPDRELEREALRLRSLLDTLMDEAVLETRDYGVQFTRHGYRFFVYDYRTLTWLDPVGDGFL
ncbi:MAG: prepilin-type N-terminal cleavage/methylation domain-containing protein, partial [Rhodospirillaceae bacterium]|nr:prepilin-type N-terminal cleavage/methylation domain-containing protein [Rhodospirillaceae bacterium]